MHFVFLCTLFRHFLFSYSTTCLLHLAQMQNVNAAVELAARRSGGSNFSAERVRQEATEWSDKGSWLLVCVRAFC